MVLPSSVLKFVVEELVLMYRQVAGIQGSRSGPVGKVGRKVALVKNTANFSSWVGNGTMGKDSPFQ
jgi:hypothetical protein